MVGGGEWIESRLREARTRRVTYEVGGKSYQITLYLVQCRYRDIQGLTDMGLREMREPGWLEADAFLLEKRDRTQETLSGSWYAAAVQGLLGDNRKKTCEATPVASKAMYCRMRSQPNRGSDDPSKEKR